MTAPDLARFTQELRPYQAACVADVEAFLTGPPGRRLYVAPTGTGKGTMQLALAKLYGPRLMIVSPTLEVLRGYVERCGGAHEHLSADKLADAAALIGVWTPVRFRNRITAGELTMPEILVIDEGHHATETVDTVAADLFALGPATHFVGFTATGYRGSPKETQELHAAWGEPVQVMTIPTAVAVGAWALPTFDVVPLLDDDVVKVKGGEFEQKALSKATVAVVGDLARTVASLRAADREPVPTVVTVSSVEAAGALVSALDAQGCPAAMIVAHTKTVERAALLAECRAGTLVIVAVGVLGEGVDLPWLKRWVDASPTMSPVAFMQKLGRVTRPGGRRPAYVGTNRNLERHSYLLAGLVPRTSVVAAQAAFGVPAKRSAAWRSLGLERLGALKPAFLPLAAGGHATMYSLKSVNRDTGTISEIAAILDPCAPEPVLARRSYSSAVDAFGKRSYGKWEALASLPDLTGWTSAAAAPCTDNMMSWWANGRTGAASVGLDRAAVPDRKTFAALPVLRDTHRTLTPDTETDA